MIRFLGSIWFAIILVLTTALMVMLGTIIESKSDSHKMASEYIYRNPLFVFLLCGYFINILFSLLSRFPLKRHHLPFTLAHIGLLMVIGGVILKYVYGIQGHIILKEGRATDEVYLSDTKGLTLETKDHIRSSIPLNKAKLKTYIEHATQTVDMWFKKEGVYLFQKPFIPLDTWVEIPINGKTYHAFATHDLEKLVAPLPLPLLLFYKDFSGNETLLAVNENKNTHSEIFNSDDLKQIYMYEEGFKGFGIAFKFFDNEIETPLSYTYKKSSPPQKKEEIRPFIIANVEGADVPLLFKQTLPVATNNHLLRFEESFIKLPFTLRLRQARTIFYPNTTTPFSYEADLLINDQLATLSMNKVYESDGYRLYLSNITPKSPEGIKTIQLTVNRDPFKWFLTYPGGIILSLGILALFFRKKTH